MHRSSKSASKKQAASGLSNLLAGSCRQACYSCLGYIAPLDLPGAGITEAASSRVPEMRVLGLAAQVWDIADMCDYVTRVSFRPSSDDCLPALATSRHAFMFVGCGFRILCCPLCRDYLSYLSRVEPTNNHEAVVCIVRVGLFQTARFLSCIAWADENRDVPCVIAIAGRANVSCFPFPSSASSPISSGQSY